MTARNLAWRGYLIALHLVLAVVLLKPHAVANEIDRQGEGDDLLHTMRLVHAQMDPQVPAGAVLFLGDSITMGLATSAVAPLSVDFGIGWQRSDQLLESMRLYGSMQRAARVVVMIGTNDLLQGRGDGLEGRYRAILAKVPAGVPVTLSSIPPSTRFDARPAGEAAHTACAADARCTFVDAFSALSAPGSLLPDGVHLTPRGYRVLDDVLHAPPQIVSP